MRRYLILGITLCFVGIILVFSYNISLETEYTVAVSADIREQTQQWDYVVNFERLDAIIMEVRGPNPNPNIWYWTELGDVIWNPYAPVRLNITVINPDNNKSIFCIWFVWDELEGLTVQNFELLNATSSCLEIQNVTNTRIRGILIGNVMEAGTYIVSVPKQYWMVVQEKYYPPEIRFLKEINVNMYPYLALLGSIMLIAGSVLSVSTVFKGRKKRYPYKSRKEQSRLSFGSKKDQRKQ